MTSSQGLDSINYVSIVTLNLIESHETWENPFDRHWDFSASFISIYDHFQTSLKGRQHFMNTDISGRKRKKESKVKGHQQLFALFFGGGGV